MQVYGAASAVLTFETAQVWLAKPRSNDVRLGNQARERVHPWLRVALNLGVAGGLLYSLREMLKRRTNVWARNNSIRAAGDRTLQLPSPSTTDAETALSRWLKSGAAQLGLEPPL